MKKLAIFVLSVLALLAIALPAAAWFGGFGFPWWGGFGCGFPWWGGCGLGWGGCGLGWGGCGLWGW